MRKENAGKVKRDEKQNTLFMDMMLLLCHKCLLMYKLTGDGMDSD